MKLNPNDKPIKETYKDPITEKDKVRYLCPMCKSITKYCDDATDQRINMRYFCTECVFATNKIGKF